MDMEQNASPEKNLKQYFKSIPSQFTEQKLRSKSSNRIQYEAEVEVLKKKIGDLESIRMQLGLSQRKICQLLFVDPSAWTRWTKSGEAPPHIYRALHWYLTLQEKVPMNLEVISKTNDQDVRELKSQMRLLMIANFVMSMALIAILIRNILA